MATKKELEDRIHALENRLAILELTGKINKGLEVLPRPSDVPQPVYPSWPHPNYWGYPQIWCSGSINGINNTLAFNGASESVGGDSG